MLRLVLATVVLVLALAGQARADSVTLNAFTPAGQSDMVAGVARIWSVSGTATNPVGLMIKYRPVGGQPCAPSAQTDTGEWFREYSASRWGVNTDVEGKFDRRAAWSWETPGTYQLCYWFANSWETVTPAITQTITVRRPTGSITATINPVSPKPGEDATVNVTGTTESPKRVYAKVRAAGAPCAPSYESDTGSSLIDGSSVDGLINLTATTAQSAPGDYVVCLWLADGGADAAPIAGPQPQPFSVVQPAPVVSSGRVVNCGTLRRMSRFRARRVASVCASYQFSTPPLPGARLTVSFVRPGGKTHTVKRTTWGESQTQPVTIGKLTRRAYRNRRGLWRAVLRVDGKEVHSARFRVLR